MSAIERGSRKDNVIVILNLTQDNSTRGLELPKQEQQRNFFFNSDAKI
jgi:hypothetical protein